MHARGSRHYGGASDVVLSAKLVEEALGLLPCFVVSVAHLVALGLHGHCNFVFAVVAVVVKPELPSPSLSSLSVLSLHLRQVHSFELILVEQVFLFAFELLDVEAVVVDVGGGVVPERVVQVDVSHAQLDAILLQAILRRQPNLNLFFFGDEA